MGTGSAFPIVPGTSCCVAGTDCLGVFVVVATGVPGFLVLRPGVPLVLFFPAGFPLSFFLTDFFPVPLADFLEVEVALGLGAKGAAFAEG